MSVRGIFAIPLTFIPLFPCSAARLQGIALRCGKQIGHTNENTKLSLIRLGLIFQGFSSCFPPFENT